MLRYIKTALLAIAAVLLAGVLAQPAHAEVSFDLAYSNLNQHGSWLVSAQYGRVWQPREYNREWNPYYDGHWTYTDMGWAWVSDYQWGSIPYHYGTWVADPYAGWVWVPGNVWAPSWVVFRTGPDYIGWAPVPVGYSVGVSIELGGPSSFVFVASREFLAPSLRLSIIPRDRTSVFINNTTVVNNIVIQNNVVVNRGPDVRNVERATGRTIREERIESVARVAPFDHVSRAQLAVDPERAKKGVRAAEQVPESRPLPVSDKRGGGKQENAPADVSRHQNGRPNARPNAQKPAAQPAVVMPNTTADTGQNANANDKVKADQAAKAQANANANANAKAKADMAAKAQANANANAKAKADQAAKAQVNANANVTATQSSKAQGNAAQMARAQANANAKANAAQVARAQANAKANAAQMARAQANAKAKADAEAKKHSPDKKDQSSDQGTSPKPKEETPR